MSVKGKLTLHKDETTVTDGFFAAYIAYLGYPVMKCSTPQREFTIWTFLIPACDLETCETEFADSETPILVQGYVTAFQEMMNFRKLANTNCGEWISQEWRDLIYQR
jgi:hypothetical protein